MPKDFEALHHTLRPRVLAYLRRFVSEVEAEDLAQDVFLKVHRGLSEFRQESKVSTWVFQIASLSVEDPAILHLCEFKELKVGDIASILDITPGAEKIHLHRARQRLKSRMESGCQISLEHRGELDCERNVGDQVVGHGVLP